MRSLVPSFKRGRRGIRPIAPPQTEGNLVVTRTREDIIQAVNDASERLADAARRTLARER